MELGSEFNLCLDDLTVKGNNTISFLSKNGFNFLQFECGRSAIRCISSKLSVDCEILLPEYICESVVFAFRPHKVIFYHITDDFLIDVDDVKNKISEKSSLLFIMNYFGAIQPLSILSELKKLSISNNLIVVEDTTHGIFSSVSTIGDYMVSSIRKWFPIPNGGLLYFKSDRLGLQKTLLRPSNNNKKAVGMVLKDLYLMSELDCNIKYRSIFTEYERNLDYIDEELGISDFSKYVLSCFDVDSMIKKRKQNYRYLRNKLAFHGITPAIELQEDECPFVFLLRVKERDRFREYLNQNNVYCAVHWPASIIEKENRPNFYTNSKSLISLPIDQRYSNNEMDYLCHLIDNYEEKLGC